MPLEKNVEYEFDAGRAMAKGYRPCLRCRPDSAPHSPAWLGVHATVKRAIALLTEDFTLPISATSKRLGITDRYLDKLFRKHMSLTPKTYKIYQQMLEAKRLLQETTLSVENVAEAVGLPSARQLQFHVKRHLQLTPTQIRKAAVNHNKNNNNRNIKYKSDLKGQVTILLPYRPPYDWFSVYSFLEKRCIKGNEKIDSSSIKKVLTIDDESVPVTATHDTKKQGFLLEFNNAYSKYSLKIIQIMKRILDLDADPMTIEKALFNAGVLKGNVIPGLRIPGVASEFEAACRAILGQQVSVAAAVNKLNTFFQHFANQRKEELPTRFPLPHEVAQSDLSFLTIPKARKQTLIDTAIFFAERYIGETEKNLSDRYEALQAILDIKGIGPWTLNYIQMRGSGHSDMWLDTDLVIKKQINKLQQQDCNIKPNEAAPFRSYLTLNLWRNSE